MRIWDLSVEKLCNKHLLGEHRELHAIHSILTNKKKGYSNHPETLRWKHKLSALRKRHSEQVKEMQRRGWNHNSNLPSVRSLSDHDQDKQNNFVNTLEEQIRILKEKGCSCKV